MAVLTGRSGQLYVDGARVAKCTGWSLDEQRPMLESTPVNVWDRTVVPGRRSGTGSAKLLYDPTDTAAGSFFDSILLNGAAEVPISLLLDSATGEGYPVTAHVSSASHAVARGEAQMRDISFKLSDTSIELEIIGSNQAAIGATQLYTGAVYGIDGAWTFLWTVSGPTISDPNSQSTNITFDALGTYTITLTATLGLTVLTDTHVVEVIDIPLLWLGRATSPKLADQFAGLSVLGSTAIDPVNQYVYYAAASKPDVSLGSPRVLLIRYDYAGNILNIKALTGINLTLDEVRFMQVLPNNDIYMTICGSFETEHIRISADLSTIVWKTRATTNSAWGAGVYDAVTDRVYYITASNTTTPRIGYVQMSSGVITQRSFIPSPGYTFYGNIVPLITRAGKVLFATGPNTNLRYILIETEKDLTVIKIVEHEYTAIGPGIFGFLLENNNHIAWVGATNSSNNCSIMLLDKASLAILDRKDIPAGLNSLQTAYATDSEFGLCVGSNSSNLALIRVSADLSAVASRSNVSTGTTPLSGNSPFYTGSGSNPPRAVNTNSSDPALGLFAVPVYTDNAFGGMVMFVRSYYGASVSIQYSAAPEQVRHVSGLAAATLSFTTSPTFSGTFARTWTSAALAPTTGTSAVVIANETQITHQTYVIA